MIPYKQLSLADIFTDCQNKFDNDKYEFLDLLEQTINLDEIVPVSLFPIFTLPPADLANIFFIQCSRLCYYSLFFRFQQHLS